MIIFLFVHQFAEPTSRVTQTAYKSLRNRIQNVCFALSCNLLHNYVKLDLTQHFMLDFKCLHKRIFKTKRNREVERETRQKTRSQIKSNKDHNWLRKICSTFYLFLFLFTITVRMMLIKHLTADFETSINRNRRRLSDSNLQY